MVRLSWAVGGPSGVTWFLVSGGRRAGQALAAVAKETRGRSGTRSEAKATGDPEELQKEPARPTWWPQPRELTPELRKRRVFCVSEGERVVTCSSGEACTWILKGAPSAAPACLSIPRGTFTDHFYAGSYSHGQMEFSFPQIRL